MKSRTGDPQRELERLQRETERLARELEHLLAQRSGSDQDRIQLDVLRATLPHLFFLIGADDTYVAFRSGGMLSPVAAPERFLGRGIAEVLPEPVGAQIVQAVRDVRERQQPRSLEYVLPGPDGEQWFDARLVPLSGGQVGAVVCEISERKRREAELRASEARLRAIFQNEPECLKVVGRDGALIDMNPAGLAMLEVEKVADVGALADYIHPEDRARFQELLGRVMRGDRGHLSFRIIGRRGTLRWVESVAAPLRDVSGTVVALISVTRDVTERRRAEQSLRESKERFQAIAEAMPIPVVITREADGRVLYGNSLLAELFEVPNPELSSRFSSDFYLDPAERDRLIERMRREGAVRDYEVRMRTATGRRLWVSFSAQRVSFEGQAALLAGILEISGRKQAEEALRTSEELYRVLFEANPFPSWAFDTETLAFLAVNDAAVRHYGYSRDEFMAMTVRDIRLPEDVPAFEEHLVRWKDRPGPDLHHVRHRKKDGSMIQVELTARSIRFQGRPARMVTVNDVTERLELQRQLHRAQTLESIGRLAGGVAHDFNNLLTAILGYTQILEGRMRSDPLALEDLSEIRRAGTRARDLTQQLLAVARRQVMAPRVVDLNTVVSEMERLLLRLMGEDVELVVRLGPGLWPIQADPSQVEQVLMNLAVNARDAMPDGGTLIIETGNLTAGAGDPAEPPNLDHGDYVMLRVRDTGIGMAPDVLAHVFEPFFTTKPVGQGTGLGLATVYGIVHQGGGRIWVDSAPGAGTTFTIVFPRSGGELEPGASEEGLETAGGPETILVVEDNPAVRGLAVRVLSKAGYVVRAAAGGTDAFELLARQTPNIDLLITDVVMPQMSGTQVAERLLRERPGMQVLYVSGYPQGAAGEHGALQPGDEFLPKPFTGPQLLARVRSILDRARGG